MRKEPCPACGSKNNLGRYSDGHAWCYGSSCDYFEPSDEAREGDTVAEGRTSPGAGSGEDRRAFEPVNYTVSGIPKRGLSEKTCTFWDYGIGEFSGQPAHFANYRDPGTRELIAQKVRLASKDFPILGQSRKLPFYGQWLWKNDRRSLIITEGELDALSVSQVQDHKYPVVSLPNGAGSAVDTIRNHYEWVCEFDKVVLMFDMDQPGREAAEAVAEILPVGKVFIAELDGFKDANEALVAGKPSAITSAFWGAKPWQPDGIFSLEDLESEILAEVEIGLPWWDPRLTDLTFGRRFGEVDYIGAGTGIGKTDWITQSIAYDILELDQRVGAIFLEQQPKETGKRICGKVAGRPFHIPKEYGHWTDAELDETFQRLKATGNLFLGGNFAAADWNHIKNRIRYMAVGLGIKIFYLDHLTALADPSNERESLEIICKELALLAQELEIFILVISHLATPDGKPHEEGGRVMLRHFKGARAIGFWAHFAFGLERNPQDEDPQEAQRTTFRVLKDRYTGRSTGKTLCLDYDHTTGRLSAGEFPSEKSSFETVANLEI